MNFEAQQERRKRQRRRRRRASEILTTTTATTSTDTATSHDLKQREEATTRVGCVCGASGSINSTSSPCANCIGKRLDELSNITQQSHCNAANCQAHQAASHANQSKFKLSRQDYIIQSNKDNINQCLIGANTSQRQLRDEPDATSSSSGVAATAICSCASRELGGVGDVACCRDDRLPIRRQIESITQSIINNKHNYHNYNHNQQLPKLPKLARQQQAQVEFAQHQKQQNHIHNNATNTKTTTTTTRLQQDDRRRASTIICSGFGSICADSSIETARRRRAHVLLDGDGADIKLECEQQHARERLKNDDQDQDHNHQDVADEAEKNLFNKLVDIEPARQDSRRLARHDLQASGEKASEAIELNKKVINRYTTCNETPQQALPLTLPLDDDDNELTHQANDTTYATTQQAVPVVVDKSTCLQRPISRQVAAPSAIARGLGNFGALDSNTGPSDQSDATLVASSVTENHQRRVSKVLLSSTASAIARLNLWQKCAPSADYYKAANNNNNNTASYNPIETNTASIGTFTGSGNDIIEESSIKTQKGHNNQDNIRSSCAQQSQDRKFANIFDTLNCNQPINEVATSAPINSNNNFNSINLSLLRLLSNLTKSVTKQAANHQGEALSEVNTDTTIAATRKAVEQSDLAPEVLDYYVNTCKRHQQHLQANATTSCNSERRLTREPEVIEGDKMTVASAGAVGAAPSALSAHEGNNQLQGQQQLASLKTTINDVEVPKMPIDQRTVTTRSQQQQQQQQQRSQKKRTGNSDSHQDSYPIEMMAHHHDSSTQQQLKPSNTNKQQQQIRLSDGTTTTIATTPTTTTTRSSVSSLSSCILSDSSSVSEVRLKWGKKMDFLLSIIGFAVDLANIWRFPYLVYKNGGGVFLIPYVTMLIFGGIPLFFLELCLGQFVKKGPITVWNKICPSMKGVGYCSILISWYVSFYYNILIAWSVYFIYRSISSFGEKMPWEDCDNSWNSKGDTCLSIPHLKSLCSTRNQTLEACRKDLFAYDVTSPASEFFVKELSQIDQSTGLDDMGYLRPELVLCTIIVYLLHYFSLFRGLETSGKVVWVTATAPYIILSILLIRGLFLPGASMGIEYYLSPKLEKLAEPGVWIDAAGQVFYSIGVGFGVHLTYASFNSHNNNCYRDCLMTSAVNALTSVYSGLVVFVYLGYMATNLGIEIDKVASEGYSLVFEVYPEALTTLPVARFWSILFFIMLLTLGIDSAMGGLEAVITGLEDEFKFAKRLSRAQLTGLVIVSSFLPALISCTQGGAYTLFWFDIYSAGVSLLFSALFETIGVVYCYGLDKFIVNIESMLGRKPQLFFIICWKYISPIFLAVVIFMSIYTATGPVYRGYVFPLWSIVLGWCLAFSSVSAIPIVALWTWWTGNCSVASHSSKSRSSASSRKRGTGGGGSESVESGSKHGGGGVVGGSGTKNKSSSHHYKSMTVSCNNNPLNVGCVGGTTGSVTTTTVLESSPSVDHRRYISSTSVLESTVGEEML